RILFVGRRINNKDLARGWSSRREYVPHPGGKDAAISGTELAALTIHLGHGRALKQVADLLDAGMRVGQAALTWLQCAVHDLNMAGTHSFRIDEPAIGRAAVIGGTVARHVSGADKITICHQTPSV